MPHINSRRLSYDPIRLTGCDGRLLDKQCPTLEVQNPPPVQPAQQRFDQLHGWRGQTLFTASGCELDFEVTSLVDGQVAPVGGWESFPHGG
jgi:hypothetical protein